ncbi:MAG: hypothetical protein AABY22_23510 [Nanoarchaeota archaeon]
MESKKYYNLSWGGLLSIIGVIFLIGLGIWIHTINKTLPEQKINFDIQSTRITIIDEINVEIRNEGITLKPEEQRFLEIRVPTPEHIGTYQLCVEHNLEDIQMPLGDETSPLNFIRDSLHQEGNKIKCRRVTILTEELEKSYYQLYLGFVQKSKIEEQKQTLYFWFEEEPTITIQTRDKLQTSNNSGGVAYYIPNND